MGIDVGRCLYAMHCMALRALFSVWSLEKHPGLSEETEQSFQNLKAGQHMHIMLQYDRI